MITSRWLVASFLLLASASCEKEATTVEAETMEPAAQLLFNGDVELGERQPDGWFGASAQLPQYVFSWADGNAMRGRRSLGIRAASSALSPSFAYWYQFVPVPANNLPGVTYVLSASVKLEQVTGAGVAIAIRGDDRSSNERGAATVFATTQGREVLTGTRDWTRVSVTLSGVPRNIDQLTIFLLHLTNSSGAVYFDDLTLSVEGAPAP